MQLLANRLVKLEAVESISGETVRRVLNERKPWQKKQGRIGPITADFLCRMEDVLDLYAEPYDLRRPAVCFDERPYQLSADVRDPLPMEPRRPQRVDDEDERRGCCKLFLSFQPLTG